MQSRHQATKKKVIQDPILIKMDTAPIDTTNWRKFRLIGGSFSNLAWQVELRKRDAVAPPSNEEEDDPSPCLNWNDYSAHLHD